MKTSETRPDPLRAGRSTLSLFPESTLFPRPAFPALPRAIKAALLSSVAFLPALLAPAFAGDGDGGTGGGFGGGAAGGVGYAAPGTPGTPATGNLGGGGGGAGISGGSGGLGGPGLGGGTPGNAGSAGVGPGNSGGNAGNGTGSGGGGGGGGGAHGFAGNISALPAGSLTGGSGGNGGTGSYGGGGGGGGFGAYASISPGFFGTIGAGFTWRGGAGGSGDHDAAGGSGGSGLSLDGMSSGVVTIGAATQGGRGGDSKIRAGAAGGSGLVYDSGMAGGAIGVTGTATGGAGGNSSGIGGMGGNGILILRPGLGNLTTSSVIVGGAGGTSVTGNGGAGGAGIAVENPVGFYALVINEAVTGGLGGTGGPGSAGGAGGAGVSVTGGTAMTSILVSSSVQGGAGGAGVSGAGGHGIGGQSMNITVRDGGSVAGGLGSGGVRAAAINFTSGENSLSMSPGATILGNVTGANGDDVLYLSGSSGTGSFAMGDLDAGGKFAGFGTLAVDGAAWNLTGSSAFSGNTRVMGGSLTAGNADVLSGSGTLFVESGTVDLNGFSQTIGSLASTVDTGVIGNSGSAAVVLTVAGSASGSFSGSILQTAGTISLVKSGSGTLTLRSGSDYTGGTTLSGGTLMIADLGALGSGALTTSNGTTFGGVGGTLSFSNAITLGIGTTSFRTTGFGLDLSGSISGAGGFAKIGTGTLTLSGTNNYAGSTQVVAGTLQVTGGFALPDTTAVTVSTGAGLRVEDTEVIGALSGGGTVEILAGSTLAVGADGVDTTFSGVFIGAGSLEKDLSGKLTLTGDGSSIGGDLTVCCGTLAISGGEFAVQGATEVVAGTLAVEGGGKLTTEDLVVAETMLVDGSGSSATVSGLTAVGAMFAPGSLTVSGGATLASQGTAIVAAGFLTPDPATVTVTGPGSSWTVSGPLQIGHDAAVAFGSVAVSAGGILTATSGITLEETGTLRLGTGGLSGVIVTPTIVNGGTIVADLTDTASLAAAISGSGSLAKQGTGTLALSGASSYTGATTVAGGTLQLVGSLGITAVSVASGATLAGTGSIGGTVSVADGGRLAPGVSGSGTLTLGGLVLNQASQLDYALGAPSGAGDRVAVTGSLTLDGVLNLAAQPGFGTGRYRLFNHGSLVDNGLAMGIVPAGYSFAVDTATPGEVNLVASYSGLQFWNGAQVVADGAIHGGSGTWDAASTNWTNETGSLASGWANLTAVFAGSAGGTVTLSGDRQAHGLQFATDGYVLDGTGRLQASGAALELRVDPGLTATINAPFFGAGELVKTGAGTIVLNGNNLHAGGTTINAGTLQIASDANLGAPGGRLTFNGGTLATTASFASLRPVTLSGAGAFEVAAGTQLQLDGAISGAGSLAKRGGGTLVLSGANTHAGGTIVSAGVLQAGSAMALGTGTLTLDGGTFRAGTGFVNSFGNALAVTAAGGAVDVNGQVLTLSGGIAAGAGGALAFVNSHADIGAAALGGSNSHSGPTTVGAGVTLSALSDGAFSANSDMVLAAPTAALMLDGHSTVVRSLTGTGFVVNANDTRAGQLTIALPSGTASFAGSIVDDEPGGTGRPLTLVKDGAGTQILTGTSSYTGGTTIAGGTLQLGDGGTSGSISGSVANDGTLAFDRSDAVSFVGAISGRGSLVKRGGGTLVLAAGNSYSGGTTISAGTLVGEATSFGSGAIVNDATLVLDQAADASFANAISGTGALAKQGAGTLILADANSYAGGTTISAGTLMGSAASFGSGAILNNAALVLDQSADASFANAINGSGSLSKRGAGSLTLTGASGLVGATTVEAGRLAVNGSLAGSAVTVLSGATLGGTGTVGATTVQAGGVIAPGNSIGTLTVSGDLVLAPGSTYAAEIAGNGGADLISVSGTATVAGATVAVGALDPQTSYVTGQRYTLLSAAGGVSGSFAQVTTSSAFLEVALAPAAGAVDLTIQVKGSGPGPALGPTPPAVFQSVAHTPNQFATALALNGLPQAGGTLALYNSLLALDAGAARGAFDALSGEIHASARTALVEESGAVRSAAVDRLRAAFGSVGAAPMATLSYGFAADPAPAVTGPMPALAASGRFAAWGQGYGSWGRSEADGNAARLTRSSGGFVVGADAALTDTLRLGLLAGYSRSEFKASGRLSAGESDSYHLGLYGGGQWGALGLRLGASYSWHDLETRRTVAFTGFADTLRAGSQAGTAQLFGELGYQLALGQLGLEPFAGLAYVHLHSGGFREAGGAAALSGRSDDTGFGYATLGLRGAHSLALPGGTHLTLRGALAWRHAFGDVTPQATLAFAGTGPFSVAGLPIARNAALVEAGLDLAVAKSTTLGLSYTGQLSQEAQDHAFKANLAVRF